MAVEVPDDEIDMQWTLPDGTVHRHFDKGAALAALLLDEQVFINSRHWKEHDKEDIAVCVNKAHDIHEDKK